MRTGKVLIAGIVLMLASGGCAAGAGDGDGVATAQSGAATATPTPSKGSDEDPALEFARCMREQGMTWFPDPDTSGRTVVKMPPGLDPANFDAAKEACKEFAPDGGDAGQADPEMVELARKMAKCMRENGVPNFPDPQPNGSMHLDRDKLGTGPGDPTFDKAEQKCSQFMPQGSGERHESGGGSGPVGA
ncbi:hypothetical protein [Paractinoplanes maris]|uniref:hypothetical protein n=1 Tax=Paractinoplanes maris TaxID=1734446 RepID=UPI00202141D5|nr:hypothetical protein [Actinoplanes maris]